MDALTVVEWAVRMAFFGVPHISTAELAQAQAQSAEHIALFDVRAPSEFAVSHIPGAQSLEWTGAGSDAPEWTGRVLSARVKPGVRTVVLYCSVGWRSAEAARYLAPRIRLQRPDVTVVNLRGSLFRWALDDRPLVNSSGPTRRIHGYNNTWSRLLPQDRVSGVD